MCNHYVEIYLRNINYLLTEREVWPYGKVCLRLSFRPGDESRSQVCAKNPKVNTLLYGLSKRG